MAFMHAVLAVTGPGDEVILPVPFYFNHDMAIQMAGCTTVPVQTDERYQLRLDLIRQALTGRTRAVVTISPNNPSGAVFTESSLRELSALCRDRGLYHISDETYEYFTYGSARHVSPGSFPGAADHTIRPLLAVQGVRLRRMAHRLHGVPEDLASAMLKSQDTILDLPGGDCAGGRGSGAQRRPRPLRPSRPRTGEVRQLVVEQLSSLAPLPKCPRPTAPSTAS